MNFTMFRFRSCFFPYICMCECLFKRYSNIELLKNLILKYIIYEISKVGKFAYFRKFIYIILIKTIKGTINLSSSFAHNYLEQINLRWCNLDRIFIFKMFNEFYDILV